VSQKFLESNNSSNEWVKLPKDIILPPDDPQYRNSVFVSRKNSDVLPAKIDSSNTLVSLKNAVQRAYASRFVAKELLMKYEVIH
jgi:hypothetical protein